MSVLSTHDSMVFFVVVVVVVFLLDTHVDFGVSAIICNRF